MRYERGEKGENTGRGSIGCGDLHNLVGDACRLKARHKAHGTRAQIRDEVSIPSSILVPSIPKRDSRFEKA